jgi:hypothetical protein
VRAGHNHVELSRRAVLGRERLADLPIGRLLRWLRAASLWSAKQPDGTLIKALARAWRWQRMLDEGAYSTVSEIGDAENISKSYVSRILRLALLAPDIVEAILAGRADQSLMLEQLERPLAGELGGAPCLARPPDASVGITTAIRVRDLPTRKTPAGALALFDRRERAGLSAGWSKDPPRHPGRYGAPTLHSPTWSGLPSPYGASPYRGISRGKDWSRPATSSDDDQACRVSHASACRHSRG